MFKCILIILFPVISFAQTTDPSHELLWEISGNGLDHTSYLFGTFHSNDKRVFNLSDSTYYGLVNAEVISIETDVFSMFDFLDTREDDVKMNFDNKGVPYVSDPNATNTLYGNEDGMPQFLDAYFQQYCYNAGKRFVALESVDFQLNLLSDIQVPNLRQTRLESLLVSKDNMLDQYLKGDIYKLDRLLKSSLSVYTNGYDKLIIERNLKMVEKIDSLAKENRVFCAIGAGHLPGQKGIINLLRSKGYRVRKVTSTYTESRSKFEQEVLSKKQYKFTDDSTGLNVLFPGKPKIENLDEGEINTILTYRDFGQGNSYIVEVYPRTEEIGLQEIAERYIASSAESPYQKITLDNGGEAYEGLADSYPEGLYWTRVVMNEEFFVILKAYGGNKFMNSSRAQRFFEKVWFD